MKSQAFTLIELLIVVAIIAILAAIAVPNFLEAQTRSKVSRVKSDMRTMATALESYAVDNNRYPTMEDPLTQAESGFQQTDSMMANNVRGNWNADPVLFRVTTPVAYVTSLSVVHDPFLVANRTATWGLPWSRLQSQLYNNYAEFYSAQAGQGGGNFKGWGLVSIGPDTNPDGGNHIPRLAGMAAAGQWPAADASANANNRLYDPTNGTISAGDLVRFGGAVPGGTVKIN